MNLLRQSELQRWNERLITQFSCQRFYGQQRLMIGLKKAIRNVPFSY